MLKKNLSNQAGSNLKLRFFSTLFNTRQLVKIPVALTSRCGDLWWTLILSASVHADELSEHRSCNIKVYNIVDITHMGLAGLWHKPSP